MADAEITNRLDFIGSNLSASSNHVSDGGRPLLRGLALQHNRTERVTLRTGRDHEIPRFALRQCIRPVLTADFDRDLRSKRNASDAQRVDENKGESLSALF